MESILNLMNFNKIQWSLKESEELHIERGGGQIWGYFPIL